VFTPKLPRLAVAAGERCESCGQARSVHRGETLVARGHRYPTWVVAEALKELGQGQPDGAVSVRAYRRLEGHPASILARLEAAEGGQGLERDEPRACVASGGGLDGAVLAGAVRPVGRRPVGGGGSEPAAAGQAATACVHSHRRHPGVQHEEGARPRQPEVRGAGVVRGVRRPGRATQGGTAAAAAGLPTSRCGRLPAAAQRTGVRA